MKTRCEDEVSDHINDAELIRYLDGELTAVDKAAIDASPEATARLNQLRKRSARMSALLQTANPDADEVTHSAERIRPQMHPVKRQRLSMSAPMRVAAAITLLLGFGMVIPPVRAQIVDWVRQAAATVGFTTESTAPTEPVTPAPVQPAPEPVVPAVTVHFDVTADTFDITHSLTAGTLVIQRWVEIRGLAESTRADAEFVFVPRGVRITSATTADAVYTIKLPARASTVRIQSAGKPTRFVVLSNQQPVRVDLAQ
jgi:hypothetical protein